MNIPNIEAQLINAHLQLIIVPTALGGFTVTMQTEMDTPIQDCCHGKTIEEALKALEIEVQK